MRCRLVFGVACLVWTSVALGSEVAAKVAASRCDYAGALAILDLEPETFRDRSYAILRARVLIQLGKDADARALLNPLVLAAEKQDLRDLLLLRGLAETREAPLLAMKDLERARELGADRDIVDEAIGVALFHMRDLDGAEKRLVEVLARSPLLSGALFNLACVYAAKGRTAEAAALVRQSWFAGLRDPDLIANDPALASVRKEKGLLDDLIASKERRCETF